MAASSSNYLFGWELLYELVKDKVTNQKNLSAALIHFALIKSNFRCIGTGDKKEETGRGSELLPEGWAEKPEFILWYIRNNLIYSLRSTAADDSTLIFNLVEINTKKVTNVVIDLETIKDSDMSTLNWENPSFNKIFGIIKRDLIDDITGNETKNADSQTRTSSVKEPSPPQPHPLYDSRSQRSIDRESHLRVGRRDLDPFAPPDGGGMIFDPFNQARQRGPDVLGIPGPPLPRGAVPPGARFDPFGPPDNAMGPRRRFPDPDDHLYM